MRTASSAATYAARVVSAAVPARSALTARAADYLVLTKPRIALLALLTVSAGYALGSADQWLIVPLLHALFGIGLVAAASSAFNQLIERESDALMPRTFNRPLPAGRLSAGEVLLFGLLTASVGVVWLAVFVNLTTAVLSAMTLALYAGVYTPLKRRTSFCTAVGAIPGALPPVLGWAASGARLDLSAFSLFAVLFLWQFPHFLAIAWIYRTEYARADLKMLPTRGRLPRVTGLLSVGYALALVPFSLFPAACGLAGGSYVAVALVLSVGYLAAAVRFAAGESLQTARGLLWTSLVYLPVLLLTLVWDHFALLT
ncbi:MAG TPA: heme o synthase [Planctomycetaceae bacterium]|nr:heme o synthase [Planctomycetaceae bacterium]